MLPTTRHIKELLNHAEEHLNHGSNSDLKFSLIHADNSIEIMLKEYLRYDKENIWGEVERKGFYDLLNSCGDIELVKNSKKYFLAHHDLRNSVYHLGILAPLKEDVESALGLAKSLFNELHPDLKFKEAKIDVPSQESIQNVMKSMGRRTYLNEMSLLISFSKYLEKKGYKIFYEYDVANGYRADIVAEKGEEVIICEVKRGFRMPIDRSALRQLVPMYNQLKNKYPSKDVKCWLITNGSFTSIVKKLSKKYNIKLIDGNKLEKLLGKIDFEF